VGAKNGTFLVGWPTGIPGNLPAHFNPPHPGFGGVGGVCGTGWSGRHSLMSYEYVYCLVLMLIELILYDTLLRQ
jgi:hypothetical protein